MVQCLCSFGRRFVFVADFANMQLHEVAYQEASSSCMFPTGAVAELQASDLLVDMWCSRLMDVLWNFVVKELGVYDYQLT